jgi:hypothetical protein
MAFSRSEVMFLLLMLGMEKFWVAAMVHELCWLAENCPRMVQQQQQPTCIIAPPPFPVQHDDGGGP